MSWVALATGLGERALAESAPEKESTDRAKTIAEALSEHQEQLTAQDRRLAEQARLIEQQRRALEEQRRQFAVLQALLGDETDWAPPSASGTTARVPTGPAAAAPGDDRLGQAVAAALRELEPPSPEPAPAPVALAARLPEEPPVPEFKPATAARYETPVQLAALLAAVRGRGTRPSAEPASVAAAPRQGPPAAAPARAPAADRPVTVAQSNNAPPESVPAPGGQNGSAVAPGPEAEEQRPEVAALAESGGVLTPKGTIVAETSLEYTHASVNRFVFQGAEIIESVLIGGIEATDSDRDTLTAATTFRYGVTDRLEVDTKIPYVYRNDRLQNLIVGGSDNGGRIARDLDGAGLGDIEFGAHYQLTRSPPYLVGNVRVKSPTGTGPFDVDRDENGLEEELATGSGFWGVEPSVTAIYPSDPVVFFGNVGYLWNIGRDVDERVGESVIEHVDPGDSISMSVGMGVSLNERASLSLGYQHDYVLATDTDITTDDGVELAAESNSLQVGSAFFGAAYRVSDRIGVNATFQVGATDDAPDVQATVRVPISFDLGTPQQLF